MRYRITEDAGATVHIDVVADPEQQPKLLESLAECQSGHCSCPTDQYERLENMDVQASGEGVHIRLEPRLGQRLDTDELRACLEYTSTQVAQE